MADNLVAMSVLRELETAMAAHPEQRVGQVIANAMRFVGGYGACCDPFYVTDEKMAEFLRLYGGKV